VSGTTCLSFNNTGFQYMRARLSTQISGFGGQVVISYTVQGLASPNVNSNITTGSITVSGNQGTPNSQANAWPIKVTDGTNGPAAVKAAGTAATVLDAALVVTEPGSVTGSAPANTVVTSTSSAILAANTARREVIITNTDVVVVYIGLGQVPTATAYHVALNPCSVAHDGTGGVFVSDVFNGTINAIVASTSGHVAVTELT
jgi:hypothetical protein